MPPKASSPLKHPAAAARPTTPGRAASDARKPSAPPASGMTVAELARQTGVSVRNIRAYQTAGLMPPPVLHGRLGLYSGQHKSRLELIREMRHMGFGLEAIGDLLARMPDRAGAEYSLIAQLFSNGFFRVEQPLRKSLAEQARLNESLKSQLAAVERSIKAPAGRAPARKTAKPKKATRRK